MRPFTEKYMALSYVWGTGPPEDWPKVVTDAVDVTARLGLQHLWVDRPCIDRNNAQEKHFLISKMSGIYECAEFTILAAAGADAVHGLPGAVSSGVADGGNDIHKNLEISGEPLIPDLAKVFKLRDPDPLLKYHGLTIEGLEYEQLYSDYWNSSGDDDGEPSADHSPSVRADSAKARQSMP